MQWWPQIRRAFSILCLTAWWAGLVLWGRWISHPELWLAFALLFPLVAGIAFYAWNRRDYGRLAKWQAGRLGAMWFLCAIVLWFLPNEFYRFVFGLPALVWLILVTIGAKQRGMPWLTMQTTILLALLGVFTFGFNYVLAIPSIWSLIVFAALTLLLLRSHIDFFPVNRRSAWLAAGLLTMFSTQIFLAVLLLPIFFVSQAVLWLGGIAAMLQVYYDHLFQQLQPKRVWLQIALVILITLLVLLSSPWQVIIN